MTNKEIPSQDSDKSSEKLEDEYTEKLVESALIHGFKFDEGQNAIIMEIDPDELEPELREHFFAGQSANIPDQTFASKVLRVYKSGEGAKEAGLQSKARQILEDQGKQDGLAKIPELYIDKEITISDPGLKKQLEANGVDVSADKVSVMLMYRVRGVDLMNYLMQELLKNLPEEEATIRPSVEAVRRQIGINPQDVDLNQLFRATAMTCGFEGEDGIVLNPNDRDRLIKHLQKNDFVLDTVIISKIEKSLKILNNKGLYHNDVTERNVMVEFDSQGNIIEVYIIDFEKSSNTENPDFGGDSAIIGQYKVLTETKDARQQKIIAQEFADAHKIAEKIRQARPEIYQQVQDLFIEIFAQGNSSGQEGDIRSLLTSLAEYQWYEVAADILLRLSEQYPNEVKDYIETKINDENELTTYKNLLGRIARQL